MKRVCVVTTVHKADDVRIYQKEIKSLSKKYEITYIAPNASALNDDKVKTINYLKPPSLARRIFSFIRVWKYCKAQNCELYHIQDPELIPVGLMLKLLNNKKVIYDVHEDYPDSIRQKEHLRKFVRIPLASITKFFEWIGGKAFDFILVADNEVYKRFPSGKTEIIYNFPDIRLYSKAELSSKKSFDIVFPGSISKQMLLIIFDITKEILKKKKDFKLLLINGSESRINRKIAWINYELKKRNINQKTIDIINRIPHEEVCAYLKESKVGIIPFPDTPKFRKNIPTKLFEYLFFKIPVVATDLPPIKQFVDKEDCSYLTDMNDARTASRIILELLEDREKRKKMGENGSQLIYTKYNWASEEKKLLIVYSKVLGEIR